MVPKSRTLKDSRRLLEPLMVSDDIFFFKRVELSIVLETDSM